MLCVFFAQLGRIRFATVEAVLVYLPMIKYVCPEVVLFQWEMALLSNDVFTEYRQCGRVGRFRDGGSGSPVPPARRSRFTNCSAPQPP